MTKVACEKIKTVMPALSKKNPKTSHIVVGGSINERKGSVWGGVSWGHQF